MLNLKQELKYSAIQKQSAHLHVKTIFTSPLCIHNTFRKSVESLNNVKHENFKVYTFLCWSVDARILTRG